MEHGRKTAMIVGSLFLIAMVASLAGGLWLEAIIDTSTSLESIAESSSQVVLGVLLELINGIAVIGIAVYLYPIFKRKDEALALGYVALRIIESVIIIGAVISPLALIGLSQEFVDAAAPEAHNLLALGNSLLEVRAILVGQMLGIFFSMAALVLYYLLYQTRIIPRFISVWGFISVALVLTWNLLELFGVSISFGMIFALSMIVNEIFMALWMIVKGFDLSALDTQAV